MPYEIRTTTNRTNRTITFDFSAPVQRYVVGVTYWKFCIGDNDHHVRRLGLSIQSNQAGSRVTSTVTARLEDSSGHDIDSGNSDITLTCIALVNADTANAVLTNARSIGGAGVPIVDGPHTFTMAFLSGWNIAYTDDDHHVEKVQLTASLEFNGSTGNVSGTALMSDNSRHCGEGTIDAGIVATSSYERGLLAHPLVDKQASRAEVDFGVPLAAAGALIQHFLVEFSSDDHHVRTIGGGVTACKVDGTKVVLTNPRAFITDDSGNKQGDGLSRVSLAVFAVPKQ